LNGIHSLLKQADVRKSADIIYCMLRISLICGPGIVNDVTKYVTQRIFINNSIVFDGYFNWTNKSNFIDRL